MKSSHMDYRMRNGLNYTELDILQQALESNMQGNFDKYQLNIKASNQIPMDRDIPDTRTEACHRIDVHNALNTLPYVSVVMLSTTRF